MTRPDRHCERSETIQSNAHIALDCFVASLLAMTVKQFATALPTTAER